MIITHYGKAFFKIQFGDTVLAFNPISKGNGKVVRFGSDIVLVSTNHPDLNGVENLTYGDREPLVIRGPGEYEVRDVFIRGFPSKTNYGGKEKINTIYTVVLEGMNICFLGALSEKEIDNEVRQMGGDIDILFVPVGGEGTLTAEEGYRLSVKLEPKIIIPILYDKDSLSSFLKEEGIDIKPVEKLTLKSKDIAEKKGEIAIVKSQG
jgi:L-ascorbate metabolism protein UlaG (beta-lactamase superfamily)